MKHLIRAILLCLLVTPSWGAGSRDFNGTTDFADAGAAANAAQASLFTVAIMAKLDTLSTGGWQSLISHITSTVGNGWELQILDTSGFIRATSSGSDSFSGTSTTAASTGAWFGFAARMNGTDCSATVHLLRYTPSTGVSATEDGTFCWNPTPSGTHALYIGGRKEATFQRPTNGMLAKALVVAGTATTDADIIAWFCNGTIPTGTDAAYVLNGTASPEPDTSGNGYNATLTGTAAGTTPDACPVASSGGMLLRGVGR